MAQAFRLRPVTAEAQVRSQVSPCEIVVDKVTVQQVLLRAVRFSLVSIIPPVLHNQLRVHATVTKRTNG